MRYLLGIFLLTSFSLAGQKQKSYESVTRELTDKIISSPAPHVPISLAVVPFTATLSSTQNSKAFGEYLTETIVGSLSGQPAKIKLFERTRIDAILKEHEFILTDLMKPAAALKIGQLAPIDALLSGTYTKLKSYIDVSARVMDVTSGEIIISYSGRIKMNKNLATLFAQNEHTAGSNSSTQANPTPVNVTINNNISTGSTGTTAKSKEEICKEKINEIQSKLHDLSTREKINAVVNEATRTPFDRQCGQLHYSVLGSFGRFKIQDESYKTFLLQTLDTIAYPAGDERALEIIRYLGADEIIDEQEWKTGLACVSRVGNYWLSSFLTQLIAKPTTDQATAENRIASYFALAKNNKLGLPRPVTYEMALMEMMEGLRANQSLRQYTYQQFASTLAADDKVKASLFSELASMYKDETVAARKTEIINWLSDFINANEYPKAHEQLYDFAWHFKLNPYEQYNAETRRDYPEADLRLLTEKSRETFSRYATRSPYSSQTEDRINFCVIYGIPVPGVIPTLAEAENTLKGADLDQQLRVMKLLVLMNEQPKPIEGVIVSLFNKRSLDDRDKLDQIQTLAIQILGNTRTTDRRAIDYMISVLPHYGNDTEAAKEALVKIGKPAVNALAAQLDKTTEQEGGLQFQLITLLGKIGKAAAPAEKSIQRVLKATRNADVKYAAEAALQAIQ